MTQDLKTGHNSYALLNNMKIVLILYNINNMQYIITNPYYIYKY